MVTWKQGGRVFVLFENGTMYKCKIDKKGNVTNKRKLVGVE